MTASSEALQTIVGEVQETLPFDPHRTTLYTSSELLGGADKLPYDETPDALVYQWEQRTAGSGVPAEVVARALHDNGIEQALRRYVEGRRIVGVMGGHSLDRRSPSFASAARLGALIARSGAVVGTEAGPGAMEAANLGAFLAHAGDDAIDEAIALLRAVPDVDTSMTNWVRPALQVRDRFADVTPGDSLGVSPWSDIYGHDPANAFMTAVAKYLARSLEGFGILRVARASLVFLPGAAGTIQEIFEAATPGYYSNGPVTPMVLVGVEHWSERLPVWQVMTRLGEGRALGEALHLVDHVEDVPEVLDLND